jgi:hypothetical protein
MSELANILSDEAEHPPTREELFAKRRQLESELQAAETEGAKRVAPLTQTRKELDAKLRLAQIAEHTVILENQGRTNGLRADIDAINVKLQRQPPAAIQRLIATIFERRTQFADHPFNRILRREHRSLLGQRTFEEHTCDGWISDAMKKFLELQNRAEDLRIADVEDMDAEIARIYSEIPDPQKAVYELATA